MPTNESNPFTSTEEYYASHRPEYGDAATEYLRGRFELDESSRVLDLGCGAGQIAVPLAAHAGKIIGMDPNEEMLREARKRSEAAGRENIEWIVGSDSDLSNELGTFHLTTMGRSFHWMAQEQTLEWLYSMTEPGGGVALLNDAEWFTRGTKEWQDEVYALADEYIEDLPERTGPIEYDDPWDELLAEFGFTDVEVTTFESERQWQVDDVVGYIFSLSYCSPDTFGTHIEKFESDLRALLNEREEETFVQDAEVTVISGKKEQSIY